MKTYVFTYIQVLGALVTYLGGINHSLPEDIREHVFELSVIAVDKNNPIFELKDMGISTKEAKDEERYYEKL